MKNTYEGEITTDKVAAARYRKLRRWMNSNVKQVWEKAEELGAIAAWMSWKDFDNYLDTLPEWEWGCVHYR